MVFSCVSFLSISSYSSLLPSRKADCMEGVRQRRSMPISAIVSRNNNNSYQSINMEDSAATEATPGINAMLPVEDIIGDRLASLQYVASFLSHLFAMISMILVVSWIKKLGGLSWSEGQAKLVFNWHPFLMVTGFCFMTVAALAFRYRFGSRTLRKLVHGMSWTVALICAVVGLVAVFKSHNDPKSGLIANMYSLHSWIGMTVIVLFFLQFLFGGYAFVFPGMSPQMKSMVLLVHKYLGPLLYNMMAFTMLLGIQEKEGFIGCSYAVDKPDLFPIQHLGKIPAICRVSHSLGYFLFLAAVTTSFALHDFGKKAASGGTGESASEHHIL